MNHGVQLRNLRLFGSDLVSCHALQTVRVGGSLSGVTRSVLETSHVRSVVLTELV